MLTLVKTLEEAAPQMFEFILSYKVLKIKLNFKSNLYIE
jgi:hypothetical protein